ncbi:MAG: DUF4159 domain-containing protein [Ascidiaceihabitans sp.]|nr:DUF4159 domain-containing protein [Ascidiaceihabitans sp.]
MTIFGVGFAAPWLLVALAALPILWLLLRAVPPAPIKRQFPGVALLLGLKDDETVSDRTPWWLLLLRMLAVAAIIVGLAQPVLNPEDPSATTNGPLLIVLDGSWAGAAGHTQRMNSVQSEMSRASAAGQTVAVLQLSNPADLLFLPAATWATRLAGLPPRPWQPSAENVSKATQIIADADASSSLWFSDGLEYGGRDTVLEALETVGPLQVFQSGRETLALTPASYIDGAIDLTVERSGATQARDVIVLAQGRDPAGNGATLATATASFDAGQTSTDVALVLPSELRARITRFEIQGTRSAGATTLVDDGLRRREVALVSAREGREGLELLSPLHFLKQALEPTADLIEGALSDVLPANPDVIVLADVATLSERETDALLAWIETGGMLLRFAGPRVAASDVSRVEEHPLMPVRLRSGGRSVGGAMSWGEPKSVAAFADTSPFFGLSIPDDVVVRSQVVAQPDPTLANRVIAELSDGTPLVTRKVIDQGQIVLFHVTANAEWSTLPLSGLFVEMLERLSISSSARLPDAEDLNGTTWTPLQVMNGFGILRDAGAMPGVAGPELIDGATRPDLLPGLYQSRERSLARNVLQTGAVLTPAMWPARIPVSGLTVRPPQPLGGMLLALALVLLLLDIVASLALSGRLLGQSARATLTMLALGVMLTHPDATRAQDAIDTGAAAEVVLANVITGNAKVDDVAYAGLLGLTDTLYFRTSIEPAPPTSINLETDELAFYPLLYWPITPEQPTPSVEAYAKLNAYLRSGGLILFDTRDANIAGFGAASPNGRKLQALAGPLDIPALEPLPRDHVLTRTFYLLQDFPGRHNSRDVWVEASPNAEQIEGMPFRNLNDGVTPVIIGGNDWAGAWAITSSGGPMLPVGRGFSGERQRELANRFGVNLVMHVLTGNYKSDQVHVPELLERLSQ